MLFSFFFIELPSSESAFVNAFCNDYPEATPLLLYRGKEKLKKDRVLCLPVEDFLKHLHPKKLIIPTAIPALIKKAIN